MKVLNKDKAKGKVFGTMKKMKKKNRLLEAKATAERTENKRINAENRKVRRIRQEELEKIEAVKIVDFVKGMLLVEVEGKVEKRALQFEKIEINRNNLRDKFPTFEVKLYGENIKISKLSNYNDVAEDIIWKVEEII